MRPHVVPYKPGGIVLSDTQQKVLTNFKHFQRGVPSCRASPRMLARPRSSAFFTPEKEVRGGEPKITI